MKILIKTKKNQIIQNRTIKKKFYHNRDSSYENINQKSNKNNKDETYKKYVYPSNNISKEFIRRKTFNNFNNKFQFEIKPQEYKGNSYQRKNYYIKKTYILMILI